MSEIAEKAQKLMEEKLLEDIQTILQKIEKTGADAVNKKDLPPMLRAWIKGQFRYLPELITKEQLVKYAQVIRASMYNTNKFVTTEETARTWMSLKNKAQIGGDEYVSPLSLAVSPLSPLEKSDLEKFVTELQSKLQLPRPVFSYAVLAVFSAKRKEKAGYVSLTKILENLKFILEKVDKEKSYDTIRKKVFGSGKEAKKIQEEIFEDVKVDEKTKEKYFKLKPSIENFIQAKLFELKGVDELGEDTYIFESAVDFLKHYKDNRGYKKYYDFIVAVIEGEKEAKFITIDWMDLYLYNPILAKRLIENPDEIMDAFIEAVSDIQDEIIKKLSEFDEDNFYSYVPLEVHFTNLPIILRPRDIRKEHAGKLIAVKGIISSSTIGKPFLRIAAFVCVDCGHVMKKFQKPYSPIVRPSKCEACKSKHLKIDFDLSEKEDIQHISIQDSPEDLNNNEQSKKINGYILGAQVGDVEVGDKVVLYAIVRAWEGFSKKRLAETNYLLEVIHVEHIEERGSIKLTPEDIEAINMLRAKYGNDLPNAVARSIAPWIVAPLEIKKTLALGVVGAEGLWNKRTSIHVLLVGDPSVAKTDMALDLKNVAPKIVVAEGGQSTGVGLTASVKRDEMTGDYVVYGGALVVGSGGVVVIDEFASLKKEDINKLKMAMEQGIVPINKASISNMVLRANSTVVATANPKRGHVNRKEPILEQLEIPTPILTRFDLIFVMLDFADERQDKEIIRSMLRQAKMKEKEYPREVPVDLLKKYFAYAKTRVFPEFTPEAEERIEKEFVRIRKLTGKGDEKAPISRRFGDALIRLSYAHAKLRLSDKVEVVDVIEALKVLQNMIDIVARDPETGEYDFRLLEAGISSKTVDKMDKVKFVVKKYANSTEYGAPITDILEELEKVWDIKKDEAMKIIDRLKIDGVFYEPKSGFLKLEG